jgi:hypothetical protein
LTFWLLLVVALVATERLVRLKHLAAALVDTEQVLALLVAAHPRSQQLLLSLELRTL